MNIELSFCELRCREVVNIIDGRRLGRIIDLVFDACGRIHGLVTPGCRRLFFRADEIFIPWRCIEKIGDDVILVRLLPNMLQGGRCGNATYVSPEGIAGEMIRGSLSRGRVCDAGGSCEICESNDDVSEPKNFQPRKKDGRAELEKDYSNYYNRYDDRSEPDKEF